MASASALLLDSCVLFPRSVRAASHFSWSRHSEHERAGQEMRNGIPKRTTMRFSGVRATR